MPTKNKWFAFGVLLLALAFGSFQEKVKISVNNIIKYGEQITNYNSLSPEQRQENVATIIANTPRDFYSHQSSISWFYTLKTSQLSKLKWINTVVFVFIHLVFNSLILFFLFRDKKLLKILTVSYAVLFIFAIGIYSIGKITGFAQPGYNVARKIVGALQSQVPLMLFVIGYYLNKKTIT